MTSPSQSSFKDYMNLPDNFRHMTFKNESSHENESSHIQTTKSTTSEEYTIGRLRRKIFDETEQRRRQLRHLASVDRRENYEIVARGIETPSLADFQAASRAFVENRQSRDLQLIQLGLASGDITYGETYIRTEGAVCALVSSVSAAVQADVRVTALSCLINLTIYADEETSAFLLRRSGPYLVTFLRLHDNIHLQSLSCWALGNLCQGHPRVTSLMTSLGYEDVIQSVFTSSSLEVLQWASFSLYHYVKTAPERINLVFKPWLLNALICHINRIADQLESELKNKHIWNLIPEKQSLSSAPAQDRNSLNHLWHNQFQNPILDSGFGNTNPGSVSQFQDPIPENPFQDSRQTPILSMEANEPARNVLHRHSKSKNKLDVDTGLQCLSNLTWCLFVCATLPDFNAKLADKGAVAIMLRLLHLFATSECVNCLSVCGAAVRILSNLVYFNNRISVEICYKANDFVRGISSLLRCHYAPLREDAIQLVSNVVNSAQKDSTTVSLIKHLVSFAGPSLHFFIQIIDLIL